MEIDYLIQKSIFDYWWCWRTVGIPKLIIPFIMTYVNIISLHVLLISGTVYLT